jgi:hypothetical protein
MTQKEIKRRIKTTKGGQLLTVPNTPDGRLCISLLKKFVNRNLIESIKVRGRGTDRKAKVKAIGGSLNFCHDIPLSVSDYLAVYFNPKKGFILR